MEVTLELAARMAVLGEKAANAVEGRKICADALAGGKPRELFLANVKSQGGDPDKLLSLRGSYRSSFKSEIKAARDGFISRIDAFSVGRAGVDLGVGRNRTEDPVSPTAGIEFHKKSGAAVKKGDLLMSVWGKDDPGLKAALPLLAEAVEYSGTAPQSRPLILKEITPK
jgi:pyrimidine-nucleoside phosphorylase